MSDASAMTVERGSDAFETHHDPAASEASLVGAAPGTAEAIEASASSPVPLPVLEARITELAGHLNAAGHRFLVLLAEFDRREGWADGATRSCAHWLSWKCGIDRGAAREKVRVARALEALPGVGAAMGRGELSYSKVRAITRVATPETEASLLMIAQHGKVDHVEAVVRGFRRARDAAELSREASQQAGRALRWHHDEDGSLVMQVRLPAEGGALLLKALQAAVEEDGRAPGVSAETRVDPTDTADTIAQRRADALVRLAESWLADGERGLAGGERQQLVVHVDAATLVADEAGRSELEGGPVLAAETIRRLGCDASLVAIVEDGEGRVLDVGRRTRSIPSAIGRALRARDGGCRFPGCTHTRQLDGHHVTHWAHGGATRLSNLVLLCRRHHRRVHEGGARVRLRDDGAAEFTDALGRRIEAAPPTLGSPDWVVATHRREGLPIDPYTAVGHWRGERLDLGLAVAGLCAAARVGETGPTGGVRGSGT